MEFMKTPQEIKAKIKELVVSIELARENINTLEKELFTLEFYQVSWDDAERYFLDKIEQNESWTKGVAVRSKHTTVSNLHIKNNGSTLAVLLRIGFTIILLLNTSK